MMERMNFNEAAAMLRERRRVQAAVRGQVLTTRTEASYMAAQFTGEEVLQKNTDKLVSLVQQTPQLASLPQEAIMSRLESGFGLAVRQSYFAFAWNQRKILTDEKYMQDMLTVYTHDFLKCIRIGVSLGFTPEQNLRLSEIAATHYSPSEFLELSKLAQEGGVSIDVLTRRPPDPKATLQRMIYQKEHKPTLDELHTTYGVQGIPHWIIEHAHKKYQDPENYLQRFIQRKAQMKNQFLFSGPSDYPFPREPYADTVYTLAAFQITKKPQEIFARITEVTTHLLHDYKDFRFIPPSIIAQAILNHSDENKIIQELTTYQEGVTKSLQRNVYITVLEILRDQAPNYMKASELRKAAVARLIEKEVIASEEELTPREFGTHVFHMKEDGFIVNAKEGETRRGVRGEYFLAQEVDIQAVRVFEERFNQALTQSREYNAKYAVEQHRVNPSQERALFKYFSALPKGSDAWKELRRFIAEHYRGFLLYQASINRKQGVATNDLVNQGYVELLQAIDAFDWRKGVGLLSTVGGKILYAMKGYREGQIGELSIEEERGEEGFSIGDTLASPEPSLESSQEIEERIAEIRARMEPILADFSNEENPYYLVDVMFWRLGLGGETLSQREVGERLGVTTSTAQYYERRALKILRETQDFLSFLLKPQSEE
jgi:RNA polymerase sigma factor (sigma-70 family)